MFKCLKPAWLLEFTQNECKASSTPSKLPLLFFGGNVEVTGGGKLSFDPHDVPVLFYQLLTTPPRVVNTDELDFLLF